MIGIDKENYGFQKNRKWLGKQFYNKISFKHKPLISFNWAISTMNLFKQLS